MAKKPNTQHHHNQQKSSKTGSINDPVPVTPPLSNPCSMYPCPQPPPGNSMQYGFCAAPAMGCGPLLQFTDTCELHNYNCSNQSKRMW